MRGNVFKTAFLLTALTLLLIYFGRLIGGEGGAAAAFLLALLLNFGAYWFSDQLVLQFYRAESLSETHAPELYGILKKLCEAAKLPMPRLYRMPGAAANAFATGRDPAHAVVAVTDGLLELLGPEEAEGVLGHELAHVANRDTLIATVAASLAGAISMLASLARYALFWGSFKSRDDDRNAHPLGGLIAALLLPLAALLIQLAVSRGREYAADEQGSAWCGNPLYLASALKKLDAAGRRMPAHAVSEATAHLFIVNPLKEGFLTGLFSTHPPVEERIARLNEMARRQGI